MLTYFLQVNLCWLLFYGLYYALLSRETFFKLNRIYLIISLLCGLVIPLSISRVEVLSETPIVEMVQPIAVSLAEFQQNIESNIVETQAQTWSVWTILTWVYGLGIAFFLLKFTIGLFKIFQLYKQGKKHKNKDFKLINTEGVKTPFSFFNWIFINPKISEDVDFQQIIAHEKAHVQQKHSFDIVGLEILRGVFWLSPLVHLYAQSLRNVHEYLADAAVLQNAEKKQYGRLLISQTVCANGLALVNHFNFSQLKKRIIMMTRNRSQRIVLMKYTLAAPIFLLLVVAFTIPNSPLMSHTEGVSREVENAVNTVETTLKNNVQNVDNQNIANDCLPENIVNLECETGGFWTAERFKKQTFLNVNKTYALRNFKLVRFDKNNQILGSVLNEGAVFNKSVLDLISKAQLEDKYSFLDIKIIAPYTNDEYVWGSIDILISNKIFPKFQILQQGLYDKNNEFVIRNGLHFKAFKDLRKVFVLDGFEITEPIKFTKWTNDWVIGSRQGIINYQAKTNSPNFDNEALSILKNTKIGESYSFSWEITNKKDSTRIKAIFYLKAVDVFINKYPFLTLPKGKMGGNITLDELKQTDYLIAKVTEKGETRTLKVLNFNVLLKPSDFLESPSFRSKKEPREVKNNGANFSEDLKKMIASAEEGDEILFSNPQVFDSEKNSNVATGGMLFTVKNKNNTPVNGIENEVPSAALNTGFSGGSITYEWLNGSTHIVFKDKASDKILNFKNVELTVWRDPADGSKRESVKNVGVEFNENVKALFKKAKLNDSYSIGYANVESTVNSKKYTLPINLFHVYAQPAKPKEGEPPFPTPILGKYEMGKIAINEFKKMTELSLEKGNNQSAGEITSFRLLRIPLKKGDVFEVFVIGTKFNEYALNLIKDAEVGDTFMFSDIVFKKKDNSESVTLPGLSYEMK
jgi:BlaR1 peptidase M56